MLHLSEPLYISSLLHLLDWILLLFANVFGSSLLVLIQLCRSLRFIAGVGTKSIFLLLP